MSKLPALTLLAFVGLLMVGMALAVPVQVRSQHTQPPALKNFAQGLQQSTPASLPTLDELLKVQRAVPALRPEQITTALPDVVGALRTETTDVKKYAAALLIAIGARQDSAILLKPIIAEAGELLLSSQDLHLQRGGVTIVGMLKPRPPAEAIGPLIVFVRSSNRDPKVQASALFVLLRERSSDPDVIAIFDEFVARPLDSEARKVVLNGIANANRADDYLAQVVISGLLDADAGG